MASAKGNRNVKPMLGIGEAYDAASSRYDFWSSIYEGLGVSKLRRALLSHARGLVLEVAVGTGRSLPFYPRECRVTAVDLSPGMLDRARIKAAKLGVEADFRVMDASRLEFPDSSFDTVVSMLAMCTVADPVGALKEMSRILKPRGLVLMLEHGRSGVPWIARLQDRIGSSWSSGLGCHLDRDPAALAQLAGLQIMHLRRTCLGIVYVIEAAPAPEAPPKESMSTAEKCR
jgi:ubiquinone/menaquinone biosynthesis C-methylase UbiE